MKDLIPMLLTKDLADTIQYYTGVLGFKVVGTYENENEMTWASLQRGKAVIYFTVPFEAQKNEPGKMSGSLYFYPDNVDELWIELQDKVNVMWPLENFHYGMREFGIKDNNGYILTFGQEIK